MKDLHQDILLGLKYPQYISLLAVMCNKSHVWGNSCIFCCDWWQKGENDEYKMEKDTIQIFFLPSWIPSGIEKHLQTAYYSMLIIHHSRILHLSRREVTVSHLSTQREHADSFIEGEVPQWVSCTRQMLWAYRCTEPCSRALGRVSEMSGHLSCKRPSLDYYGPQLRLKPETGLARHPKASTLQCRSHSN